MKKITGVILSALLALGLGLSFLPFADAQNWRGVPATSVTGTLSAANGGTGVANNAAATFTRSGNHALTVTTAGTTGVTLPTSGTLLGTAAAVTVAQGGTGAATLTGIPLASGTTAFTALDYVAWTTPTFAAGSFTSDVGTWVVAEADATTYAYTIIGKTMTVSFSIATTTTTGTPNILNIAIPASKVATKNMRTAIQVLDAGTRAAAVAYVEASGAVISIQRMDAANFANATDTTYVFGQITFQIN